MFVDYSRECQYKIGFLPLDTTAYCSTAEYLECPFYKAINNIGHVCEFMKKCPAFEHFRTSSFHTFVKFANDYCLSKENNTSCQRFSVRQKGVMPPSNLMPDGSIIED
jgi:hypothetical protein